LWPLRRTVSTRGSNLGAEYRALQKSCQEKIALLPQNIPQPVLNVSICSGRHATVSSLKRWGSGSSSTSREQISVSKGWQWSTTASAATAITGGFAELLATLDNNLGKKVFLG
jgi:hypothetical protein